MYYYSNNLHCIESIIYYIWAHINFDNCNYFIEFKYVDSQEIKCFLGDIKPNGIIIKIWTESSETGQGTGTENGTWTGTWIDVKGAYVRTL